MTDLGELDGAVPCACALGTQPAGGAPGLWSRLTAWRVRRLARRALLRAGEPGLVLDLSAAEGRFWPLLAEKANRVVMVGECSAPRLAALPASRLPGSAERAAPLIELGDNAVDCIFCLPLLVHRVDAAALRPLLGEFLRVTRDSAILAVRLAGGALARFGAAGCRCCAIAPDWLEGEFALLGFRIDARYDDLPGHARWRVYLLRKG